LNNWLILNIEQFTVFNAEHLTLVNGDNGGQKVVRQKQYELLVYSSSIRAVLEVYLHFGNWVATRLDLIDAMPYCFHVLGVCSSNVWHPSEKSNQTIHNVFGNTHLAVRLILLLSSLDTNDKKIIKVSTESMKGAIYRQVDVSFSAPIDETDFLNYAGYTWNGLFRCNHLDCLFQFHSTLSKAKATHQPEYLPPMNLLDAIQFLFCGKNISGHTLQIGSAELKKLDFSLCPLMISNDYPSVLFKTARPLKVANKCKFTLDNLPAGYTAMKVHDSRLLTFSQLLIGGEDSILKDFTSCLTRSNMEHMDGDDSDGTYIYEVKPSDYDDNFFGEMVEEAPPDKEMKKQTPAKTGATKSSSKKKGGTMKGNKAADYFMAGFHTKKYKNGANFTDLRLLTDKNEVLCNQWSSRMMIAHLVMFLQFRYSDFNIDSFLNCPEKIKQVYIKNLEVAYLAHESKYPNFGSLMLTVNLPVFFNEEWNKINWSTTVVTNETKSGAMFNNMSQSLINMAYRSTNSSFLMNQLTEGALLSPQSPVKTDEISPTIASIVQTPDGIKQSSIIDQIGGIGAGMVFLQYRPSLGRFNQDIHLSSLSFLL
jgi:hypothetical protein